MKKLTKTQNVTEPNIKLRETVMHVLLLILVLILLLIIYVRQWRTVAKMQEESDECRFFNQAYGSRHHDNGKRS